ncbi:MAG: SDR family oxidoreductase [Chloroflexia bacterium]|nr:SDR family oxidoreductase [Chloroflexia bacterium]
MPAKLKDAVVVITGASSGIGRATAREFARKGAVLVLAARRDDALREVRDECERLGARAVAVTTDVTDDASVEQLAHRAVEAFGHIDVWVNDAGVTMFGRFDEVPVESNRRVVEVNLLGTFYGSQAAIRRFRERNSGVLINVSSGFGRVGAPMQAAYVATKHGQRGLSEALRQELHDTDIHVCTVLPTAIDTPVYRAAANYTGHHIRPLGHLLEPEKVAKTIVRLAEKPRREVAVGEAVRGITVLHALAPGLYERISSRRAVEQQIVRDEALDPHSGNLFEPVPEWTGISGGYKPAARETVRRSMTRSLTLAAATGLALYLLRPRNGTSHR